MIFQKQNHIVTTITITSEGVVEFRDRLGVFHADKAQTIFTTSEKSYIGVECGPKGFQFDVWNFTTIITPSTTVNFVALNKIDTNDTEYQARRTDILEALYTNVSKACCDGDVVVNVGGGIIYGTATGTDTYALVTSPVQTSYSESVLYRVEFTNANTVASTLNIDGVGAAPIISSSGAALVVGDILANRVYVLAYDGTSFQLSGVGSSSGITTYAALTDAATVDLPTVNTPLQTALAGKVDENAAIVGATKTKVTYDAKGLVTSGENATTADIADSTDKRYVTDAQQTVISNTSGTNTGDNAVNTTSNTYADGKVADAITDGVTTIAPSQNAVFDALAAKKFQTYPLFGNTVGASTTRYFSVGGGTGSTTESAIEIKIITACTIIGLGIRTSTAQSGTGSMVVTLRKNGANTAITFTIAAGSAAGYFSDTVNSVSFAAGDTICIACVNNATATSATVLNGTIVG